MPGVRDRLRRLSAWLGAVLFAGGAAWFAFGIWPSWREQTLEFISRPHGGRHLVLLSLAAALASQWFAPMPWTRILESIVPARMDPRAVRRNWYVTQMGTYIPGKVWMFLGRIAFLGSRGAGAGLAAAAITLENVFLMAAVCLVALAALPFTGGSVPPQAAVPLGASLAALVLVVAFPASRRRLASLLSKDAAGPAGEGPGRRDQLVITGLGAISWSMRGLSLFFWALAAGLASDGGAGRLLALCLLAVPVSWLAALLWVLVPGGIGIREGLQGILLAGFTGSVPVAVTISLAHRILLVVSEGSFALATVAASTKAAGQAGRILRLLAAMFRARLALMGIGRPPMPVNVTFSVTRRCQSRCRTCLIWQAPPMEEMDLETIGRVFRDIGWTYFFNISGGEPFLRSDLPEIVRLACRHLSPAVVHIPTNALMPARIEEMTREILAVTAAESPGTMVTVKPSFDGIGEAHDAIRGVPGNWERLVDTLDRLRRLRDADPTLHVGVGTVISRFNESDVGGLIAAAREMGVDTYINEIAEEREEFFNLGSGVTPSPDTYGSIMSAFKEATLSRMRGMRLLGRLTSGLRLVYYDLVVRIMTERRQVVPCYAGLLNVHINADGDIWPCAIRAYGSSMGSAREGFREAWRSPAAARIRRSIRRGECWCPLANQAYSNILMHAPSLLSALRRTLARRGG